MAKWFIGFVVIEFLFLLVWIAGVDRNQQRRQRERGKEQEWPDPPALEDDGGAWGPNGETGGGQYRGILVAELEATAAILTMGIEKLKTDPDISLAGLREFRDGLAAQMYVMRKCKTFGAAENNGAYVWDDRGGLWMLDKG